MVDLTSIPELMAAAAEHRPKLTGVQRKEYVLQVLRAELPPEQVAQAEALIELFVAVYKGYYAFKPKSVRCCKR